MKKKILCGIIAIIIVIGAVLYFAKGFNKELLYLNRQEMLIASKTEIDLAKIEEIVKNELQGQKSKVQRVERFDNAVKIIGNEISEEQKENIVSKINEELNVEISSEDTQLAEMPGVRIKDLIKPYIIPAIISFVAVLLYFIIVYNKIGLKSVLLNGIFMPIIAQLTYYSIILIARIQFGRVTNAIAVGLYVITIGALSVYFQRKKEMLPKNNEKGE